MIESWVDHDDLRDFAGIAKRWLVWMKSVDRHLCKLRTALKNQVSHMAMAIAKYFPPDTRITAPWSERIEEGVKVLGELAHQFGGGRIAS